MSIIIIRVETYPYVLFLFTDVSFLCRTPGGGSVPDVGAQAGQRRINQTPRGMFGGGRLRANVRNGAAAPQVAGAGAAEHPPAAADAQEASTSDDADPRATL